MEYDCRVLAYPGNVEYPLNRKERRRQRQPFKKSRRLAPTGGQPTGNAPDIQQALNLALQHYGAGELSKAEDIYKKILKSDSNHPVALHLLGVLSNQMSKNDIAVELIKQALATKPYNAEAHNDLGNALKDLGRLEDAVASYQKALAIQPDYAEAHSNLGVSLQKLGKLDEAVASHHKALAIKPDLAEAHNNLGVVLQDLEGPDEAVTSYRKALAIKPDYVQAHKNLGIISLLMGDFETGWPEYSWRQLEDDSVLKIRAYPQPFWDGGDLTDKTIFIYHEQGLGDTIQFVRYLPMVRERGGHVAFDVPLSMVRLFRDLDGIDIALKHGDLLPPFDCHIPLLELPRLFGTTLDTIPTSAAYLHADKELVEAWGERLGPKEKFRIGIVWAGNPILKTDRDRSMDPSHFLPLTEIPRVSVYSLQFGKDGEADKIFGARVTDIGPDLTPFTEAAAAIMNLDLVVTVDTSLAHLAGALGCPVWTLLPFIPDWRWMLDRDDSPWYPTMRLFRQEKRGEWEGVIERVAAKLADLAKASPGAG
jgi:Flp pilus assembly protein TadD